MDEMPTIKLDGSEVPEDQLQEQQKRKDIRIVEVAPGEYKTLQRLDE